MRMRLLLAQASKGLDVAAAQQQMLDFAGVLTGSRDARRMILENPSIPTEQKLAVLDALAERLGLMREVRNFIAVVMDHHRLAMSWMKSSPRMIAVERCGAGRCRRRGHKRLRSERG